MLANESEGSTNNDPPVAVRWKIYQRLTNLIGFSTPRTVSDGYVEFGNIADNDSSRTLGTFSGVFSPVTLSMFSALIFIRVGFIVGNAGLLITLLQFLIAYAILLFTVASVCAVSTNGAVEGGGAYFMISRTLGPEFGGSIGTLFFLANVVSSALCISGCAEGLVENFGPSGYLVSDAGATIPDGRWWRFLYCTLLNTCNLLVCLIGAAMFARTSVAILAVVTVCLASSFISFFVQGQLDVLIPDANQLVQNATHHAIGNYTGILSKTLTANLYPEYGQDYSSGGSLVEFATVFGVLFSGVTGIMAGANMSGELKNPARSIPLGTLSAVGFTFICYIVLSVLIAATSERFLLQNNFIYMMPINVWPPFVAIGILTATFSAALSNLIGSSRVLEALAKDNVFGSLLNFVTKGTWRGNPIAAVFTSWLLVQCILLIGSLNTIAQINSVLFLLSYLATNLACLGLELASAPNFRPSFKYFTWYTATIGLFGTLIMMFVINSIYASSSIILCLILIIVLHLFSPASRSVQWGSISQALMFHQVRKYLLMLDSRKDHVKFWRPQILLLIANPRTCCPLIDFVNDLKKGGLYVLGHVKVGEFTGQAEDPVFEEYPLWLSLIDHTKVKAFVELTVARTIREGFQHLIRISGMGAMKPNTIVLGFYDDEAPCDFFQSEQSPYQTNLFDHIQGSNGNITESGFPLRVHGELKELDKLQYVWMISDVLKMKKNLCICRHFNHFNKATVLKSHNVKYIDVWPVNFFEPRDTDPFDVVSLFMMQLATIIHMLPVWKTLQLRVFLCESGVLNTSRFNMNDVTDIPYKPAEYKLKQLLKLLRINASIHQIPGWARQVEGLRGGSITLNLETNLESTSRNDNIVRSYLLSVNQLIHQNSEQTAVLFIYLPAPSSGLTAMQEPVFSQYLQLLTELTADLPPTILVHGVSAVTSTTL